MMGTANLLSHTVLVVVVLASWALLMASQTLARNFNLLVYVGVNLTAFLDLFDCCLRLYWRRTFGVRGEPGRYTGTSIPIDAGRFTPYQKRLHMRPYALLVSVYNAKHELDEFLEAMQPFRDRLWVIEDCSTDYTSALIRQAGFRCIRGEHSRKKPGAIRTLLDALPPEVETVMVLDPDITIRAPGAEQRTRLETVIFDFQQSGAAALCPRVAIRQDGFLARLQAFEYCLSFSLGRCSQADYCANSGVALYRRAALASALEGHTLSVYAEDLQTSLLLLGAGERGYYDGRLVMETMGKRHWRDWFSQRVGWYYGLIKVYIEWFDDVLRVSRRRLSASYHFLLYTGVFALLVHPLKLVSLVLVLLSLANGLDDLAGLRWVPDWEVADPIYFLATYSKYFLLIVIGLFTAVPREDRLQLLSTTPMYFFTRSRSSFRSPSGISTGFPCGT
jgi:cellulose synthase/poly-beta-1,6-N-acetylglucosamine synthase-like glycosyltransferase